MNDFVNEGSNGSTTNDACSDADLKMISNATKSDGSPCVSCLGILEEGFENEVVEKVRMLEVRGVLFTDRTLI